jgi:hypothetical protein
MITVWEKTNTCPTSIAESWITQCCEQKNNKLALDNRKKNLCCQQKKMPTSFQMNTIITTNRAFNNKQKVASEWLSRTFGEGGIEFVVPFHSQLQSSLQPNKHYHAFKGTATQAIFARWEVMCPHVTCIVSILQTKPNAVEY